MNKANGSGNGHDKDKIVKFPSAAERKKHREEQEKAWREEYKQRQKSEEVPFLNIGQIPIFTRILVSSFIIIQLAMSLLLDSGETLKAYYMFGFVPGYFTGSIEWSWSAPFSIITHMFIHGGWMHIAFNSVMGLVFCMFFEREFGTRRAVIFFFACGIAGALTYLILNPFATSPVIGASGGISGLFAAMLVIMQQRNMMGPIGKRGIWPVIIFWALFMVLMGLLGGGDMAWQAHVGGFLGGALLLRALQKGFIRF